MCLHQVALILRRPLKARDLSIERRTAAIRLARL
jgi:hypothetical protein